MSQNTCCVSGCQLHLRPLHSFPLKLPHLFTEWIRRVKLVTSESDEFIGKNRKVCDAHFNSYNKNSEIPLASCARLKFCSVPTINVPGFKGKPTKDDSFCFPPDYFNNTDINKQAEDSSLPKPNETIKSFTTTATTKSINENSLKSKVVTNDSIKRNIESETMRKETLLTNKEPEILVTYKEPIDDSLSLNKKDNKKTIDSEPVITGTLTKHKSFQSSGSIKNSSDSLESALSRAVSENKSLKMILSFLDDITTEKSTNLESVKEEFEDTTNEEEFEDIVVEMEEFNQDVIVERFDELQPPAPRDEFGVTKQNKPASFPLICRICATSNAYLIPIFGEEGTECDLGMKISSYLPLQVNEEDSVCFPCALTLISFHQLMINCKTANALFSLQPDDIQTKVIDPVAQNNDLLLSEQCVTIPTHSGDNSSCMEVCPLRWKEIIATTNTKYLTCHLCYESFLEFNQLKDHIVGCEKIMCKKCRRLLQNSDESNKHTKNCKVFQCDMCTRTFTCYVRLISHALSKHPSIRCPFCTKKFMNDLECEKHKTTEHNFLCECCNKTFPSSLPVMKHRLSIMPHGALMCLSCFGVSQFIPKIDNQFIIEDKKALKTKFVENCSIPRLNEEGLTATNKDDVSSMIDAGENEVTIMTATINGGRELNDHSYTLRDNNAATCTLCSKSFSNDCYLKMHIYKHHPTEPAHRCENCFNRFKSEELLKIHSKYKCPQTCGVCDTVVEGTRRLKVHKRQHHQLENSPLPCHLCNKVLTTKYGLNRHIKNIHQGLRKKVLCFDCGNFIFTREFKKHYNRYHNTEPVRCKYCLKTVASNLLYQHITETHIKGQFKCDICSRVFCRKRILVRHLKRMHNTSSSKSCVFCNAPFTNSKSCDRHIANHHKKDTFLVKLNNFDEYKCLHCEVVFDYTNAIDHKKMLEEKYGKLVNGPVKKYKVYVDPKSSLNKPNLDCITCGKQFASTLSLQNHINDIHIALLKFQCSYCPKSFKRKSHKQIHERTHTDERPYTCSICNRKFRQRGDCNRHVARHCNSLDRKQFVVFEKPKRPNKEQVEFDQMNVEHEVEITHQMY